MPILTCVVAGVENLTYASVQRRCLRALTLLTGPNGSDDNKRRVMSGGAIALVLKAMEKHADIAGVQVRVFLMEPCRD